LKDRDVSKEEGERMANRLGCSFLEADAKADVNVHETFATLAREINKSQIGFQ
jgi:GTPase KRas protein